VAIVAGSDEEWRNLCAVVPALSAMAGYGFGERVAHQTAIDDALGAWARPRAASAIAKELVHARVPAAALASSLDLVSNDHLSARNFWEAHGGGVLPGLPWRASFGRTCGAAPELGADTEMVLREVLGSSPAEIAALREAGAFGSSTTLTRRG
jgi:crotonobetainyl-CoA:carnitine CoA-transferase CaiB-like acyl-CoA transferase